MNLQKFDLQKLVCVKGALPTSVIIGKRAVGKSWLVRDILWHNRDMPVGAVVSPTEQLEEFYGKFMPHMFIHNEYSNVLSENILKRQQAIIRQSEKENNSHIDPRIFVVLDCCLYDQAKRDMPLRTMFMNGRCMAINLIITMQYPLGIGPELRSNVDYVFLFGTSVMNEKHRMYQYYAGMFPSFEVFCETLDRYTRDYGCLVIDNTVHSENWEDMVFWYRAEPRNDFRIGSEVYWDQAAMDVITTATKEVADNGGALKRKATDAEIRGDLKKIKTLAETIKDALDRL